MPLILGVDPGLRATGWGLVRDEGGKLTYLACGTIKPKTTLPLYKRLALLHKEIDSVISQYQPHESALEETFVTANGQSTLKLGQARGALMLSLAIAGLPVSEYAARLVKKTITGNGRAEKTDMMEMGFLFVQRYLSSMLSYGQRLYWR